ncbi:MAG: divergent PAP2 family protein, partial [Candidatus Krumholzibacteria bacterium]|nr:divergent PAP2 family protein [Candidatus Krumholzibacteria bacterium]
LYREIFLVPVICGLLIQGIKLILQCIAEKRFKLDAVTQADGMPNLHSAVFSSLSMSIGMKYGFSSILFSVVAAYSAIIIHDTMRLKGEKVKQTNVLNRIISSNEGYQDITENGELRTLRFKPLDVLSGTVLGIIGAYCLL